MLWERWEELAVGVAIESWGSAMGGADPKLHVTKDHEHQVDGVEREAYSATCSHTERWDDPVVTAFGVVVKDGCGEAVIPDVIV